MGHDYMVYDAYGTHCLFWTEGGTGNVAWSKGYVDKSDCMADAMLLKYGYDPVARGWEGSEGGQEAFEGILGHVERHDPGVRLVEWGECEEGGKR